MYRKILDEPGSIDAMPDEVAIALAHVEGCKTCRDHIEHLEQSDLEADPEELERIRERLRQRVRLAIMGPITASAALLAVVVWMVVQGVQRDEFLFNGIIGGYFAWLFAGSLLEIRQHRRNAQQFMEHPEFLERCQEEMDVNRGLNVTFGLIHATLACVITPLAIFVWPTRIMFAVAVCLWLLVAYNLFRVFVLPKPWNGVTG